MSSDSGDEIEACQKIEPHELVESVKSKAIVKFAAIQSPAKFNRLECNTDLNLPPTNWLTTSDNGYGIHQAVYHTPAFTSFRMAHMFPDCVGEVDVVSDAENIKRLLKIPYASKGVISMIVHKVGNTLLIDEFDIQKYLLRRADDDWKWLKTFILEQIVSCGDKDQNICLKDKSRQAIQRKNLLSKFLYHSLIDNESPDKGKTKQPALPITGPVLPEPKIDENVPDPKSSHDFNRNVVWTFEDIRMLIGTDMPIFGGPNRPCISLRLRDMAKPINVLTGIDYWLDNLMCNVPEVVMCYHLDGIVQKYEIIKTEDLPYLEDSQFSPQVVRTVAQNILSFLKSNATKEGHTYWLFKGRNDDVVKLYDLTTLCDNQSEAANASGPRNEDLTNPFTIPVAMLLYTVARNMKSTAQRITPKTAGNICSLLNNCIKLLPKEKFPQIVTSSHYILSDLHIPLGIDPKYPNFDSSDTDSDSTSVYGEEEDDLSDGEKFEDDAQKFDPKMTARNICAALKEFKFDIKDKIRDYETKHVKRGPSPLILGTEDRCKTALNHISDGLNCLRFYNTNEEKFIKESEARAKEEERQRILHEEQHPNMAKPFKPIPLPYECLNVKSESNKEINEKIKPSSSTSSLSDSADPMHSVNQNKRLKTAEELQQDREQIQEQVSLTFNSQKFGSWNVHLKLLLFEKACLVYATLAECKFNMQMYGSCLKAIYMAYKCQKIVMKYVTNIISQKSCLLGRAGDCLFQMGRYWSLIDVYMEQFEQLSDFDENIMLEISKEIKDDESSELIYPEKNEEHLLSSSCKMYNLAIKEIKTDAEMDEDQKELLRRLGNTYNELGVRYMYWSQEEYTQMMKNETEIDSIEFREKILNLKKENKIKYDKLALKSFDCLRCGIVAFKEAEDNQNLALLYCNMGRFLRFRAHLVMPDEHITIIQKEKHFYKEAFTYYENAKDVLQSRKRNPDLWDKVNWELSTATFNLAKQLQDYNDPDNVDVWETEKEVLDLLQKALKLCDVDHPGSRQILYTYRSGLLHKRIASFHYSQLRRHIAEGLPLPKAIPQLCKNHYEKAAVILDTLRESNDLLQVQLERMWLLEFLSEQTTSNLQKIKNLQAALKIGLQAKVCFEYAFQTKIVDSNLKVNKTKTVNNNENDENTNKTNTEFEKNKINGTKGNKEIIVINTSNNEEFQRYTILLESRIQYALKNLIKLFIIAKDPKKQSDIYRKMYLETLTGKYATGGQQLSELEVVVMKMHELLQRLIELENEISDSQTQ